MEYRCEATSVAGFVQQLAVAYVGRGYFFYVTGEIPERKDPRAVDAEADREVRPWQSERRRGPGAKLPGSQTFNTSATGASSCFSQLTESISSSRRRRKFIRDAREVPIKFGGYAVSYRSGHPHVRIEQRRYLELKAYLADLAVHRAKDWLEEELSAAAF